jgi:UDP:flavonoid glycosyltransferase YjiC (YdhE family)
MSSRILIVATAGAGGDLQPLASLAIALRERGHDAVVLGDASVERTLAPAGLSVERLPDRLDLGPRLIGAIRDAMERTRGDLAAAGPLVQQELGRWAAELAPLVHEAASRVGADACVTSLFGVEALDTADLEPPWAVVNSTFYIGPDPPRPIAADIAPRAVPLIERFAGLLERADLVLHATDRVFDLDFDGAPDHHHYVGPLGVWEPALLTPPYLDEAGDPWVLITLSSQAQDDLPLAIAAIGAVSDLPVRAVVTVGGDHRPDELGNVPANVRVERTISHAEVLERAEVFVGHAGHGSVMKALTRGVPMVLVPWGRDQPGVAWRAGRLGVAEVVRSEDATAERLADAVEHARSDPTMKERAWMHRARLGASDPQREAAGWIETLL